MYYNKHRVNKTAIIFKEFSDDLNGLADEIVKADGARFR